MKTKFIVDKDDARPAGKPDECFYCKKRIGERHKKDCVIPKRRVCLRMTVEIVRSVPHDWNAKKIESYLNDSSWCSSSIIKELQNADAEQGCLCGSATFEYAGEVQ